SKIADDVIQQLQHEEPERVVKVDIEPGLSSQGDPQLLQQLLYNLLGNAWKFTRLEAQAHIEFSQVAGQPEVIYRVRDNGAGFDSAHMGQLFKPFQRLHASDQFEGTGVGLATAHRIVSRHGGRIWAEAKPGQGAEFYFSLSA
ncbi:MAG: ATP-binding protein, partial [Gammaproteobacteria bacterium]|nr:ATP-binding protein [Gammaproteobacteria bacterium]